MQILESKVLKGWMEDTVITKKGEIKKIMKPVIIGTYVELDDGNTYVHNGETFKGAGTRVRWTFVHQTFSVQSPDIVETDAIGYKTDTQKMLLWQKGEKVTGFKEKKFRETYGTKFIELVLGGHEESLQEAIAIKEEQKAARQAKLKRKAA